MKFKEKRQKAIVEKRQERGVCLRVIASSIEMDRK